MSRNDITPDLYELFKTESNENIALAEAALLKLEKSIDPRESIDELFRAIHTIKGSAVYLELFDIKDVTHGLENVLESFRKNANLIISKEQLDVFFDILNVLTVQIANSNQEKNLRSEDVQRCLKNLKNFKFEHSINDQLLKVTSSESQNHTTNRKLKIFKDTVNQQIESVQLIKNRTESAQLYSEDSQQILDRALGCILNASQFVGDQNIENCTLEFQNWMSQVENKKKSTLLIQKIEDYLSDLQSYLEKSVHEKVRAKFGNEVLTSDLVDSEESLNASEIREKKNSVLVEDSVDLNKVVETKTVRVDQEALDNIMNLVGELIIIRNSFTHIQGKFLSSNDSFNNAMKELRDSSSRLTSITGELQRNIMEMRMVPIKTVFQRYPRIVRDICRKTGKDVEVFFEGEDTEIDRGISDLITDPLVHIVRNAVDHGIESAAVRIQHNKSATGTIIMKAYHQGNFMVLEIMDDGGGINTEKVRDKIIENGLLDPLAAAELDHTSLIDFIFHPGFSTATKITDISGRGVGLDVVRTNLKKIKGQVSVTSELGLGTCFRLEVPLTMAIMRAILVNSSGSIYAIALQDVRETVKIYPHELKSVYQKNAISLRGEVIIVEWLHQLLELDQEAILNADQKISVLILQVGEKRFGIIVDSVYKQEEIVIKPLPDTYSGVSGLAGASILGDGKVILILDSAQLNGLITGSKYKNNISHHTPDKIA